MSDTRGANPPNAADFIAIPSDGKMYVDIDVRGTVTVEIEAASEADAKSIAQAKIDKADDYLSLEGSVSV